MHGLGGIQDYDMCSEGISVDYIGIYHSEGEMHTPEKVKVVLTILFAPLPVRQPRAPARHIQ
jgi:hypothetical protein